LSPSGAEVIPLLRFLYTTMPSSSYAGTGVLVVRPDIESRHRYPLVRTVFVVAVPVVRFLLEHGASPCRQGALPVKIAIRRKDLALPLPLLWPYEKRTSPPSRCRLFRELQFARL
jgi:hypothetical protein